MSKITFLIGAGSTAINAVNLCIAEATKWGLFANVFSSTITILCVLAVVFLGGLSGLLVRDLFNEAIERRKRKHSIV